MKTAIFLVLTLAVGIGSCSADMQKGAVEPASKEEIRATIKEIVQATFERAAHRQSSETVESVSLVLLHVTDQNRKRVRDFADEAVSVLREYVSDSQGWRQQAALELLSQFRSEEALAVLMEFAEHSRLRYIAVADMGQYPIDKIRVESESDGSFLRCESICEWIIGVWRSISH
jgi:hypothetical protein